MVSFSVQQRFALAAAVVSALLWTCAADSGWVAGRATWFDVGPDMKTANCHYSWAPTGRNVGAWPDPQEGFASSCGKCYEVRCRNADITDGYGQQLKRSNACYDEGKSVIITIVDACPCKYPNNAYSNQRWCCGDMNHIDISQEAFQQLANLNQGVIGLSYREVDCNTKASVGSGGSSSSSGSSSSGSGSGSTSSGSSGGNSGNYQTSTGASQQSQQQQASWSGWWSNGWRH